MIRYAKALTKRDKLITQLGAFLSKWDTWLCPVTVGPAFKHCTIGQPIAIDGQDGPYFTATMSFTTVFSMTGNPVVVASRPVKRRFACRDSDCGPALAGYGTPGGDGSTNRSNRRFSSASGFLKTALNGNPPVKLKLAQRHRDTKILV